MIILFDVAVELENGVENSSVILAAIERLEECHVVARLNLDGPNILVALWSAEHQTEGRAETLDLNKLHLDTLVADKAKLGQALAVDTLRGLNV